MIVGSELTDDLRRLTDEWAKLTLKEKMEFARGIRNEPPESDGSILRQIWERYRGPDVPRTQPANPPPDSFFKKLIRKSYGSEDILDDIDVEKVAFLTQKVEMTKARARELYPGFNFDE